jgi:hypothetical protein
LANLVLASLNPHAERVNEKVIAMYASRALWFFIQKTYPDKALHIHTVHREFRDRSIKYDVWADFGTELEYMCIIYWHSQVGFVELDRFHQYSGCTNFFSCHFAKATPCNWWFKVRQALYEHVGCFKPREHERNSYATSGLIFLSELDQIVVPAPVREAFARVYTNRLRLVDV